MIENLPVNIDVLFILTTLAAIILFYKAAESSAMVLGVIII